MEFIRISCVHEVLVFVSPDRLDSCQPEDGEQSTQYTPVLAFQMVLESMVLEILIVPGSTRNTLTA